MVNEIIESLRERYLNLDISKEQERALLIVFGAFLAIGGLFFALSQGGPSNAAQPKISIPKLALPAIPVEIVIDVSGKVAIPGVYRLPVGSRAIDALTKAGGAKKGVDLSDINLAHVLSDGEQIIVGAPKISTSSKSSKTSSKKASGPVSINRGTLADLDSLPGIGPVMANRIISYRLKNGLFKTLEELRKVPGMGASKFAELQALIKI